MEALDVLGDPVRRRILELLATGERTAGDLAAHIGEQFGISQPAVSQHLRVLRESGFTTVRPEGTRRLYSIDPAPFAEVEAWAAGIRRFWDQHLDALGTELARGRRARHAGDPRPPTTPPPKRRKP
jgi:DNA-binding transcriptional ArsR family regulator